MKDWAASFVAAALLFGAVLWTVKILVEVIYG
jgi:hypothetical protein